MNLFRSIWISIAAALALSNPAAADGNITFGSKLALPSAAARAAPAGTGMQPGLSRAVMAPVTPEESTKAVLGRPVTAINQGVRPLAARVAGDNAVLGPASIAELARALRGNPDLIYEYVRNNIEYLPTWGIQKGEFGTLLDNQGTAFDQSALMVALLRQSGYTASFVTGRINLTAAQVRDWLGVDTANVCAVINLLGNAQIPIASVTATAAGSCPGSTVALYSLMISHVWVKVNIGGTNYYFDPSYKPHTLATGINVASATGYSASAYLSAATSGATITTDYVQGINRSSVRANLTAYANNLAAYLRTNLPAATLDDVIGGKKIVLHNGAVLRQTTLPYQDTSLALTEWADIPANYKPTLRIQYQGIDRTFTSDAIYGQRLTITYNSANQPVLALNGTALATGTAVALNTPGTVALSVSHGAYTSTFANQAFTQQIKAPGTFLIGNGWGSAGRGPIERYRAQLADAVAAGSAPGSEVALGSSLALLSASWIGQVNHADYITDRLARTTTLFHHQIGIAGYNTAPYVDLPGNMVSVVSQDASSAREAAVFFSSAMHSSIFESTAVQQTTGASAVSTVKLVDLAVLANDRIYDARAANYASAVQPNLVGCAGWSATFQSAVSAGRRLLLPARCTLAENSWTGTGYFSVLVDANGSSIGAIIGGGLAGGFATTPQAATTTTSNALSLSASSNTLRPSTGSTFGDPIDMTKGHYLYAHTDLASGVGEFPASLAFTRHYTSGNRYADGQLGLGWTSDLLSSVRTASDGFQGMGEDAGLDAAAAITEKMVSLDLLADTTKPVTNMVVATIGQRWFGEQITDNTAIVTQGLNAEVFVRLPNGTFNGPPGNGTRLTRNADTSWTYETVNKSVLRYGAAGSLESYTHPSGIQARFSYSGGLLAQVSNSLGRTLSFTSTAGRISAVSDGSRSVALAYDGSRNLLTYTNPLGAATTYQYDLPGRMTRVFYPANPTNAFLTNTYDTLGRIQTQANALGKVYTYFFAGSRSEELGPYSQSSVSYMDVNGKVLKTIDPAGKIVQNTYDGQTRLVNTVLPEGNSTQYTYDDAPCAAQLRCTHNLKRVAQTPKPGSTLPVLASSFTYEASFNKIATSTDPRGFVTSFTYTAQGAPLTVTRPAVDGVAPLTTYGYTAFAASGFPAFYLQTSVTNRISSSVAVVDTTSYVAANKYVPGSAVRDAGGLNLSTTFTYDAAGNLTQVDGPRTDVSDIMATAFDTERRPTQLTDAFGKVTRNTYDADGRQLRSAAQSGTQWLVTCTSFSVSGKPLRRWGPSLMAADTTCPAAAAPVPVTDYAYDDLDRQVRVTENLTAAEGGNRLTDTVYNLDNTVQSTSRAVGSAMAQVSASYTYSANGLPLTVNDAASNRTTYEYDGHDRLARTRFPSPTVAGTSSTTDVESNTYDNGGNVVTIIRRNGATVAQTYDALGRLTARTVPAVADNIALGYDLLSRMLSARFTNGNHDLAWTYDNAGRRLSATAGGKVLAYQYDAGDNLVRTTWPDAFYVTTTFDALNRPLVIRELGSAVLASYAYDDRSRRTTTTLGNGTTSIYAYSAQGALAGLQHDLAGTAQDVAWTYTRNQAQDIATQSWNNDLYQWTAYFNGSRSYARNGLNQYTAVAGTAQTHDASGNLSADGVWSYGYDAGNRLRTASKSGTDAALAYDATNRLRKTIINGVTTELVYNGADLAAEYDGAGVLLRRYVAGPDVDEALVQYNGAGTTDKTWLYLDQQGSTVAGANSAGSATGAYTYGPFGEPGPVTGPRLGYTGQQYIDALGLNYFKARFYAPALGRFLQTDSIGYADGLNLYGYVGNNPVNFTDPSGNCPSCIGAAGSVLLGGAIRYATSGGNWSAVFDGKAMAVDAALGAVGAGLASKATNLASLSRITSLAPRINQSKAFGSLGEEMLGIAGSGKTKVLNVFPDKLTNTTLIEVKNAAKLGARDVAQIQTEATIAAERGLEMTLYTRPGMDLSKVQSLIDSGKFAVKNIPGIGSNGARILTNGESAAVGAGVGGAVAGAGELLGK